MGRLFDAFATDADPAAQKSGTRMGTAFGQNYAAVNAKTPRKSDRVLPMEDIVVNAIRNGGTVADFLPVIGGAKGSYEEAKAGNVGMSLLNAATVPVDLLSGGLGGAAIKTGLLGTFIGKGAKTWDALKAAEAEKRLAKGDDVRKVWKETGTFKGPDGHLRQEIDDTNSMPGHRLYSWGEAEDLKQGNSTVVRRQKAILHPELSAAYPDTKNIGVILRKDIKGGYYDPDAEIIRAGSAQNGAADRSTMLHELQHAIQQREGWARGGSSEAIARNPQHYVSDDVIEYAKSLPAYSKNDPEEFVRSFAAMRLGDPYDAYRRLAGEAEARATQARMNMNMEQRLNTYPLDSYDIPVDKLIIRGNALSNALK